MLISLSIWSPGIKSHFAEAAAKPLCLSQCGLTNRSSRHNCLQFLLFFYLGVHWYNKFFLKCTSSWCFYNTRKLYCVTSLPTMSFVRAWKNEWIFPLEIIQCVPLGFPLVLLQWKAPTNSGNKGKDTETSSKDLLKSSRYQNTMGFKIS